MKTFTYDGDFMPLTRSEKSTAMVHPEIAETTFEFVRGGGGRSVGEIGGGGSGGVEEEGGNVVVRGGEKEDLRGSIVRIRFIGVLWMDAGQISWREHLRRKKVSLNPAKVILDLMDGLEKVWDVKPLVNGKEIMSVLQLKSGWPLIREREILVDRASCRPLAVFAFRFGGEKNIHPTLVRDDFTQAMHDFLPVAMRDISKPSPEGGRSGWDDVGGLNDIRNAIKEMIELPSKFPNIFAKGPLRLRSNVLLYGHPGCDKTHIVGVAIATACSLRFISMKGPELLNKYIGASEQAVRWQ
ncbi:hypothetical protein Pint_07651 [Pistacia integerrima]|uniref:Uncharacterized protein n=1 Tax=Pistacia integerrima TaxID=434235 RepID=A0ACC0XTA8_9ROSI|nr:hypothetical protein Pint_07651 [Pistacia integerrima]